MITITALSWVPEFAPGDTSRTSEPAGRWRRRGSRTKSGRCSGASRTRRSIAPCSRSDRFPCCRRTA
jgi:hypothetical protein